MDTYLLILYFSFTAFIATMINSDRQYDKIMCIILYQKVVIDLTENKFLLILIDVDKSVL